MEKGRNTDVTEATHDRAGRVGQTGVQITVEEAWAVIQKAEDDALTEEDVQVDLPKEVPNAP